MPLLLVSAAVVVVQGRTRWRGFGRTARRQVCAALAALYCGCSWLLAGGARSKWCSGSSGAAAAKAARRLMESLKTSGWRQPHLEVSRQDWRSWQQKRRRRFWRHFVPALLLRTCLKGHATSWDASLHGSRGNAVTWLPIGPFVPTRSRSMWEGTTRRLMFGRLGAQPGFAEYNTDLPFHACRQRIGVILFEMISNRHPFYTDGNDLEAAAQLNV